jgi:hypothetical protein
MRQCVEGRRLDGQERIEQMSEGDPLRLRDEPKEVTISVKGPCPARLFDHQAGFVAPVEQLLAGSTGIVRVREGERVRAVPLDLDDPDRPIGKYALH